MIKVEILIDAKGKCDNCGRRLQAVSYRVTIADARVTLDDVCADELREVTKEEIG